MGQVNDLTQTAVACEFNDLAGVEAALAKGDVAAILTEPVMTNSCMVLPEAGFHDGLRQLTLKYGALLIMDETHTISSGLGGYTRVHSLRPTCSWSANAWPAGCRPRSGACRPTPPPLHEADARREAGRTGMGTTLSANPMQFACLVANLSQVMTPENYDHMEKGANGLATACARRSTATMRPGMWCGSARGSSSSAPPAPCATAPRPAWPTSPPSRPRSTPR